MTARLEEIYADLIRASLPPNPQFERERIIVALPNRREIVFILGLLSEGENEAALLLALVAATRHAQRDAPVDHLLDEAAYYLRTSIDETWQIEERRLSARGLETYLETLLANRLAGVRGGNGSLGDGAAERRALLESLLG
jgi:hypothetical protein